MKMLKAKLVELAEQQQKEKISDIKGEQMDNGWGSQIRSYVFQPTLWLKTLEQVLKWVISVRLWTAT